MSSHSFVSGPESSTPYTKYQILYYFISFCCVCCASVKRT
uniref:Uncharacterized protein n=1 Tax=Anguilla anguilla TaxID=7936 RepID=A0A0E9W880_ANGAN